METISRIGAGLALLCIIGCGAEPSAVVDTRAGQVRGVQEDGVATFRGVPYAAPPVGERRWRAPAPLEPWSGVRDATEYGPACWQASDSGEALFLEKLASGSGMSGFSQWLLGTVASFATLEVSEDCLTLNVIAPANDSGPMPVMFWIHGGGHQFGSGGGPYESPTLARRGVVLVTINYRLGLYGFLAHPELAAEDPHGSTGNYGMLDQIAALEWVRDNIGAFGGDPDNVTIFGESAGGHSVGQLMASPLAEGLFHRAIAQSGTGFYQFQAVNAAHERMSGNDAGRRVAELAGVSGEREVAALRALSVEDLEAVATDPEVSATFHPQIDGHVLPGATAVAFAGGAQARVPLMVGSNADEGSVLYLLGMLPVDGGDSGQPSSVGEWDEMLDREFGTEADGLKAVYTVDEDREVAAAGAALMGDTWFGRHAFYMAKAHSAAGNPTYLYFYERRPAAPDQTVGASHALEIGHVFGGFLPFWPADERDAELTDEMQTYWTRFAATGDPNAESLPPWPRFEGPQPMEMAFGHERSQQRPVSRQDRYTATRPQFEERVVRAGGGEATGGD